jgi:hypothetical protein
MKIGHSKKQRIFHPKEKGSNRYFPMPRKNFVFYQIDNQLKLVENDDPWYKNSQSSTAIYGILFVLFLILVNFLMKNQYSEF